MIFTKFNLYKHQDPTRNLLLAHDLAVVVKSLFILCVDRELRDQTQNNQSQKVRGQKRVADSERMQFQGVLEVVQSIAEGVQKQQAAEGNAHHFELQNPESYTRKYLMIDLTTGRNSSAKMLKVKITKMDLARRTVSRFLNKIEVEGFTKMITRSIRKQIEINTQKMVW